MTALKYVAQGFLGLVGVLVVVWLGQALVVAIGGPVFLAAVAWFSLKALLTPAKPRPQGRR